MEWILSCFVDIRDWVSGKVSFCKRFRENNKLLEFCGRSNKAVFVVLAEYYGGACQGCVMIPASSNRADWSLFQREMRNFFIGAKLVSMAEVSSKNGGGRGGQSASGDRSGNLLSAYGHQQKFRNFEKVGANLGQNGILGVPIVNGLVLNGNVSVINGRPTRAFTFKLTPATLALKVCKPEGGKRSVTCMGTNEFSWPKALSGGLELIIQSGGLAKAQPMETIFSLKGTLVKPGSLKESHDGQAMCVQGESLSCSSRLVAGSPVLAAASASAMVVSGLPVSTTASASARGGPFLGFPVWRGPIGGHGKRPRLRRS